MKKLFFFVLLTFFTLDSDANLIEVPSNLFQGILFQNEKNTSKACYTLINRVSTNKIKGKHCQDLLVQFMFGLDDRGINDRSAELVLTSRKTNSEGDFHKPTTCAEVVSGITSPWEVDKWGDDTTDLFNQVFNAQFMHNKKMNHYTLNFSGKNKTPSSAMIYRLSWYREDKFECRNLNPVL